MILSESTWQWTRIINSNAKIFSFFNQIAKYLDNLRTFFVVPYIMYKFTECKKVLDIILRIVLYIC